MANCKDCGLAIEWQRAVGKWNPVDADGQPHYLTCSSERARDMRVRRGQEPGIFPVDPTRIRTYIDCPAAYKRRYVDRIPDEKGPAAQLGIAVHRYAEARLKGEEPPAPVVPLEYARDWRIMRDTIDLQLQNGLWDLRDAAVEDRLKWTWTEGAMTVELMVVMDWWACENAYPVVTDIKSGWGVEHDGGELFKVSSKAELKKSVQGQANILVIGKHVPIEGGRFQEVHLRYGGELVWADYEPEDIAAFEEVLRAHVALMIRDNEFVANPFCTVCPPGTHPTLKQPITIGEDGKEITLQAPRTREEAERLAAYAHAARRVAFAATDALKGWCAVNGPTGTFAHVAHVSKRIAPFVLRTPAEEGGEPERVVGVKEVVRILEEQGWGDLLPELVVVSGTKLRSVLNSTRKYVSLAGALAPLLIEEHETRFEERRVVEEAVAEPAAAPVDGAPQLSLLPGGQP